MVVIKPSVYHMSMLILNGRDTQIKKVVEELTELKDALISGDRDKIIEELGDVQNVLPYLQLVYLHNEKLIIKNNGLSDLKYPFICDTLIRLIHSVKTSSNINCQQALSSYAKFYCETLYTIYNKYDIPLKEIEDVISAKQKRTIYRKFKEILHV